MANSYDFSISQGCSFLVYLSAQNSDGSSINLSGYNARGFVKNMYSDGGYIYNLNPSPILPFESGIVAISGNYFDTSLLPAGSFLYDIEIFNGISSIQILNGDFDIYPSTAISEPSGGFITAQTGAGAQIIINNYYINSGIITGNNGSGISYSSILTNANIIVTGYSNYVFTGNIAVVWTLPSVSGYINSNYFIKNRGGASITLTGINSDMIFANISEASFTINSGEAYILFDDGNYWNIM